MRRRSLGLLGPCVTAAVLLSGCGMSIGFQPSPEDEAQQRLRSVDGVTQVSIKRVNAEETFDPEAYHYDATLDFASREPERVRELLRRWNEIALQTKIQPKAGALIVKTPGLQLNLPGGLDAAHAGATVDLLTPTVSSLRLTTSKDEPSAWDASVDGPEKDYCLAVAGVQLPPGAKLTAQSSASTGFKRTDCR